MLLQNCFDSFFILILLFFLEITWSTDIPMDRHNGVQSRVHITKRFYKILCSEYLNTHLVKSVPKKPGKNRVLMLQKLRKSWLRKNSKGTSGELSLGAISYCHQTQTVFQLGIFLCIFPRKKKKKVFLLVKLNRCVR